MSINHSLLARRLRAVAAAVCQHPAWFIYPQLALAALGVLYAAHGLRLDLDRDNPVGAGAPYHQTYLQFRQEFPGQDPQVVLVESGDAERDGRFVERLAARLEPQTNLFTGLCYKRDWASLGPKGLLLASTAKLEQMRCLVGDQVPVLRNVTQATNLVSLFCMMNGQLHTRGPEATNSPGALAEALPLLQHLVEKVNHSLAESVPALAPDLEQMLSEGSSAEPQDYLTAEQGQLFLLTVRPRREAQARQAVEALRRAIAETQGEVPGVNVGLTGGLVLHEEELRQAKEDLTIASIVALTLYLTFFVAAYGEVGRPLQVALCLGIGLGYTLGFATLTVGHLNLLSVTFAPMLLGLTLDFALHFLSRYEEERRQRRTVVEAIERASVFTGQSIVIGGLTTAAAFLALGLSRVRGLQEVGLICGGGLLLCLVPLLTTLPALLLQGRPNPRDLRLRPAGQARLQLERVWLQHPLRVMALALGLCALAVTALGRAHFDQNLLHLPSRDLPAVREEQRLLHSAGESFLVAAVVADSVQQAQEYEAKIAALPAVARVESAAPFLTEDQQQKLVLIRAIQAQVAGLHFAPRDRSPVQIGELSATLRELAGELEVAETSAQQQNPALVNQLHAVRQGLEEFSKTLLGGRPQIPGQLSACQETLFQELDHTLEALQSQDTRAPLRAPDLPPAWRDRFIGRSGKYLLEVHARTDLWEHQNQREFLEQLHGVVPPERVTGLPVELYYNSLRLKQGYQQAAWYALGAIGLVLLLHFRSPGAVLLALLPVGLGALWLLGLMGALGVAFNSANLLTLPLVVGIGVTNGIQMLHRLAEEPRPGLWAGSTGKAVLVSGLMASSGFGTLLLAKHQGLQSLGQVMSAGLAASMLATLALVPVLLSLRLRRLRAMQLAKEQIQSRLGGTPQRRP